jgi:protease-4
MPGRRRLLRALAVTGLVFVAVFIAILGLLVLAERGGLGRGDNRVALVEVDGLIVDAEPVVRELEEHAEDEGIRAVVVRIQSPGGVVAPTQEIHDAILRVRSRGKPVVASMGAIAASGGYYLAVAADRIVANPGTLTGSIGVLMQLADAEGLLRKVGVRLEVVKAGRHKDIGNPGRALAPEERAILQALLDDMYDQFVSAVARGRDLPRAAVLEVADGRVYSGRRAKELRLVDELGGLEDAVRTAGRLAGIEGKPSLVRPRRPFHLADLLDWLGGRSGLGGFLASRGGVGPLALPGVPKLPLYLME